jgi:hypothetical protein
MVLPSSKISQSMVVSPTLIVYFLTVVTYKVLNDGKMSPIKLSSSLLDDSDSAT